MISKTSDTKKDQQHESVNHWMTGVVLFGFEELQPTHTSWHSNIYLFIYLFIHLFIYLFIYLSIYLFITIHNVCIAMFASLDYNLYM